MTSAVDRDTVRREVHGYGRRHLAQHPERAEIETSRRRYSLVRWGHDLLRK